MFLELWESRVDEYIAGQQAIVALGQAVVDEFNGRKYLKSTLRTLVWYNPEISEGDELKLWFQETCRTLENCASLMGTGEEVSTEQPEVDQRGKKGEGKSGEALMQFSSDDSSDDSN